MLQTVKAGQPRHAGPGQRSPRPHPVRHVNLDLFTLKDIPDISLEIVLECLNENEYGDARLFAELFTGRCVYDHTDGLWYIWQGHHWKVDNIQLVKHLVSGVLASTYLKAVAEINLKLARLEAQAAADDEEAQGIIRKYKSLAKELSTRAHALKFVSRMKNVLSNAQAFLPIEADRWDTDPWILGTQDGVLDLKTGKLRPGKPEDYIRTIIPTKWEGLKAPHTALDKFWQEVFADRPVQERSELISFIQRFFGYALTGRVKEHLFMVMLGDEGRNGKGTWVGRLQKVLGTIATIGSKELVIATKAAAAPGACKPHLAHLQGKRIVFISETDKGERFSAAQVKELSGGDNINTRNPYGKREFVFSPSHTVVLLTNNPPHADAGDDAFWQRMCPMVFNMRFISHPDPDNPLHRKANINLDDELDKEASGILSWLVEGCLAWQRDGMQIPACVLKARAEYRKKEDTIGKFIDEECVVGNALNGNACEVAAKALYAAYAAWCKDNTLVPMSGTSFGIEMGKKFQKKRAGGGAGNLYQGVGLKTEYPNEVAALDRDLLEEDQKKAGHPVKKDQGQTTEPPSIEEARARKRLGQFRAGKSRGYDIYLRKDGVDGLEYVLPRSCPESLKQELIADVEALNDWLVFLLKAEEQVEILANTDVKGRVVY